MTRNKGNSENTKGNILVIDDVDDVGELVSAILKPRGFKVITAKGGLDALPLVEEHHFEMIFLDISLEDEDGLSLLRKLKKSEVSSPICMLSSHRDRETVSRAIVFGADDYLVKPIEIKSLLTKVDKALGSGEKSEFTSIETLIEVLILGNPLNISLTMTSLSEGEVHLTSSIELIPNSHMEIEIPFLEENFNFETTISLKTLDVFKKESGLFHIRCKTLGVHESTRQAIRRLTLPGKPIHDPSLVEKERVG